jgi:hypothetical protein
MRAQSSLASLLAALGAAMAACGGTSREPAPDASIDDVRDGAQGDGARSDAAENDAYAGDASDGTVVADAGCPPGQQQIDDGGCVPISVRRPFLVGASLRTATARARADWAPKTLPAARIDPATRARLAQAWLADALEEHASIAAFARFTMLLLSVGAPPDFVVQSQRASIDEVRHAERCFALAARYAGSPSAPGPLPLCAPREGGLARLARDTFLEGCVGETVASLSVARALAGCLDAEVCAVLRGIGDDEERHAALAWRTLSWTLAEGGPSVAESLRQAWQELRDAERAAPVVVADSAEDAAMLAAHGRLDRAAERRVRVDALESIVAPTLTAIMAQAANR